MSEAIYFLDTEKKMSHRLSTIDLGRTVGETVGIEEA